MIVLLVSSWVIIFTPPTIFVPAPAWSVEVQALMERSLPPRWWGPGSRGKNGASHIILIIMMIIMMIMMMMMIIIIIMMIIIIMIIIIITIMIIITIIIISSSSSPSWLVMTNDNNDWWMIIMTPMKIIFSRRKFRSQTSDNMDRWKAEVGRVREEKRREEERERIRRKKIQVREKVGKSRNTVFFQWFVAPERRRLRNQLARWEMKNCTPLWRKEHVQVKMYKTHQVRNTFRSCNVEKVHAVVARSTFRSQNVQNTPGSEHF